MITFPSARVPIHTREELNVNLTIGDRSKKAGYGYFRGCTAQNWQFPCSTMPYNKSETCTCFRALILNSCTANQNQDVSHDQNASHSYHSNLECIRFGMYRLSHSPRVTNEIHAQLLNLLHKNIMDIHTIRRYIDTQRPCTMISRLT